MRAIILKARGGANKYTKKPFEKGDIITVEGRILEDGETTRIKEFVGLWYHHNPVDIVEISVSKYIELCRP